jgi:hypothetical protein
MTPDTAGDDWRTVATPVFAIFLTSGDLGVLPAGARVMFDPHAAFQMPGTVTVRALTTKNAQLFGAPPEIRLQVADDSLRFLPETACAECGELRSADVHGHYRGCTCGWPGKCPHHQFATGGSDG